MLLMYVMRFYQANRDTRPTKLCAFSVLGVFSSFSFIRTVVDRECVLFSARVCLCISVLRAPPFPIAERISENYAASDCATVRTRTCDPEQWA